MPDFADAAAAEAAPSNGAGAIPFAAPLGCPLCQRALSQTGDGIHCPPCERRDCPREFAMRDGFPDLVVGERFEDDTSDELLESEERNTAHTMRQYWLPRFRTATRSVDSPSVLSLGCGAGLEVDLLREAGFNAVGIDNGNRTRVWRRRSARDALVMANGMHLPFPDATFDIAFCGCVFPHVGVIGDTFRTAPDYWRQRLAVAGEMARVVKPGGSIFVSSPNRLFPIDLFHGRKVGSYRTPVNPPWRRFLLSAGDYRRLFLEAGCQGPAQAQSIRGYWGFCRSRGEWLGALLSIPVRGLFFLGSNALTPFLRASPLLPWIVVQIRR